MLDFRSDTITKPTLEMIEAMEIAPLGNASWDEDPTVNMLQDLAAEKTGKEAAMFLPSGTMANLLAAMTHCENDRWGGEVILGEYSHSYWYEAAGLSKIAGLSIRTIPTEDGHLTPHKVEEAIRPSSKYAPISSLLWIENPSMIKGGTVTSLRNMKEIYKVGKEAGMKVHMDGARLFNAALALDVDAKEITKNCDSVMFCISKGLSCPVGSVLCGSKEFIEKAKRLRIMLGGTMRQAGVIAAAGVVALKNYMKWLPTDHENAKILGEGINGIMPGCVDLEKIHTNMVVMDPKNIGISSTEMASIMEEKGIKTLVIPGDVIRFVTSRETNINDVNEALNIIKDIIENKETKIKSSVASIY